MPPFDLSAYINPVQPLPNIDITGAYRQWQQHHLNEEHLAEQKREFNESEERSKYQFDKTQDYNNRVSNDINARFAITQGENTNTKNFNQQSDRFKQQQALLAKARQAASENRWNEVEAHLGTLKSLGANVERTLDSEGRPSYRLQESSAPEITGESYESTLGKINSNRGGNPFETSLGTVSQSTRPETQPNTNQDTQVSTTAPEGFGANRNIEFFPGTHTPDDSANQTVSEPTQTEPQPSAAQSNPAQSQSQSFDPYAINSSQLQRMNEIRLNPLLAGIEGAFPNRFSPQIQSLTGGMRALGASPEATLEMMQKPMDTAARLMGSEMAAEGQMARAGITQSGKEDSQNRLLVNDGEKAAERVSKEFGVSQAVSNSIEMQQIAEQLLSDNRNANADGVKALLSMREGNRLTDKDFNIGATGIASNFETLKLSLQRIYKDGLTPDQKSNFRGLITMFQDGNKRRIQAGSKKMLNYIQKLRSEPERYGAWRHITGSIPDEFLPNEIRDWDPARSFGGARSGSGSQTRKSVNVTAPTTQGAVNGAQELNGEEVDINSEIDKLEHELDEQGY